MKAYDIPISKSALKMLKRDFAYRNFLTLEGMHLTKTKTNSGFCAGYLATTSEYQVRITVICRYASVGRLYTIAKTIEHTFDQTLLLYIENAVDVGIPAAEAIQKFMDKYDISDEDLSMSTVYKRWQRYVIREKKRQMIPLW